MPRQFVKCVFRPGDSRSYTYLNEGDPVASGDWVKVPDKSGEGWKKVQVVEVSTFEPPFACKPILGIYSGEDAEADAAPRYTTTIRDEDEAAFEGWFNNRD